MTVSWLRARMAHCRRPQLTGRRPYAQPRRGQATIMLALMMVPLIGMLGLAVDGGVYLYARRTAQAAADAGALAGARQLSKSINAQADVNTVVGANGQGDVEPTVLECRYVNDINTPVGPASCTSPIPSTASGVLVRTQESVRTFFLPVIPGAPRSSVVTASAIARVQMATGVKADAPFIVCGFGSWNVTADPDTNNGGTTTPILLDDDPLTINLAAIGKTFRIWDSRLSQEGAGCDTGSQFKGLANSEENEDATLPNWIEWDNGTKAGPTRSDVNGPGGCAQGIESYNGCVLILPLATDKSGGSSREIWGVGFAAFLMSPVGSNSYNGTLLNAYIISAPGSNGWTPAKGGVVSVRLAG
ncbi:MAG: pilus assembly protein [Chloroflexota bacterium]|nr:pilus assembly protein [Chloroflexota bacterium]